MAQATLLPLFALPLTGCLVTSTPSFEDPERTPPFLMSDTSLPDVRAVQIADFGSANPNMEFSVGLLSEDNDRSVKARLVLDYGVQTGATPYKDSLSEVEIDPATLDDPPRTVLLSWFLDDGAPVSGCHNISILATHDVNLSTGCPKDPADFDFITWMVIACNSQVTPCCDPTEPPEDGGCETFDCPAIDPAARCDLPRDTAAANHHAGPNPDPGGAP